MSTKDAEVTEDDRRAAVGCETNEPVRARQYVNLIEQWCMTGENGCRPGSPLHESLLRTEHSAQIIANARRDAYRAGQIAGLEEGKQLARDSLEMMPTGSPFNPWQDPDWSSLDEPFAARIRELKGET